MPTASAARVDILPAKRRAMILEHIRDQKAASIADLAAALGASASTVRRDLDYLEERGYIERTHGGAVVQSQAPTRFEPEASIANETAGRQKAAIAVVAFGRLSKGQTVLFDASSTVRAVAALVAQGDIPLTAVTNDLSGALILSSNPLIHTIVTGGTVRSGSATLHGSPGMDFLTGIHVDIAFIGVHSVSREDFTETSLEVAAVKQRMITAARKVIVLADSGKFGVTSFCKICPIHAVDEIITDSALPGSVLKEYRDLLQVTVAPSKSGEP
jgi:DeoR family transcriptional regulator, aga operon transcriptional repressor